MRKINKFLTKGSILILVFILSIFLYSCDLIDPTEVTNPDITEENLMANATGGTSALITGLHSQFANTVNRQVIFAECVSDNYENTSTNISPNADQPAVITPDDVTMNSGGPTGASPYFQIQNLRALADFGISTIIPKDKNVTDDQKAEVYFYRGMALTLLAENYWTFPIAENGGPVTSAQAIQIAITDFQTAYSLSSVNSIKAGSKIGLARAYRIAGNKASADAEAKAALALSPSYLFTAVYDEQNLANGISAFVVIRNQNDMQPLPRLDFLDPKYHQNGTSVPFYKAEEAHLIIAEVAISNGDLATAKNSMKNAVTLAKSRATATYNDRDPRRNRPNDPTYKVKADASAQAIAGLIQQRGGSGMPVTLYPTSNTSVTAANIDALTSQTDVIRMLYLLRQEIFFNEGRRMSDLGIRLPVMKREIDVNPNFPAGSAGTTVKVPSFIPGSNEMDKFTVDAASGTVTCMHDMNKIIANNYATIKPF